MSTSKELDDDQKRKDRHRYLNCVCLIQDVAKDVLVDVLKARLPGEHYGEALVRIKHRLLPFLNNHQRQLLYPDGSYHTSDLSDMDISLLYLILRHLGVICSHQNGWGNDPEEQDRSISANIDRIRVAKNRIIANASNCSLGYAEFNNIWGTIRQCCLELGGEKYGDIIDTLFTSTIEGGLEQHNERVNRKLEEAIDTFEDSSTNLPKEKSIPTKHEHYKEKDIQLPWLVDAKKFHDMLSHGAYLSYEHRLSLGGPCRAGKSTLASILIGDEIPLQWNSTDGLVILFGRNGIDIEKNKMVPLKEGERGHEILTTILQAILKHWVDSILTYTDDSEDIMPMILFAATHRDQCKEDTTEMTKRFSNDIKQMFSMHEKKHHIHLETVYFINGVDKHDVEIQLMTDQIVSFARKQSSWGQRRPMQWVPLQQQISNLKMKNINIITKKDIQNVNDLNDDLALDEGQLNDFLSVQHSLGKLMYYNLHGLNKFVIIHPPALVNILRSFVTDKKFFPAENDLKSILQTLTKTGKIDKTDLLKLWQQDHLKEYMPNDAIKEFILQLLIHLDILIIPKANTQNSVHNVYLVPCMIKASRPLGFNSNESQIQRTICLRYSLALHSIPTALAYKIVGASITCWPLQDKNGKPCLYHKAAVLNVNEDNEIRIWLEDNRVLISLANQKSLLDISPDIAASVQECLSKNLVSSLSFYYNSFGRKINQRKVSELYTMEVGFPCGESVCFISSQEVTKNDKWICDNGKEHETRYLRNWVFNKSQKTCGQECKEFLFTEVFYCFQMT